MHQPTLHLSRTIGIDAAPGSREIASSTRHALNFAVTFRTALREMENSLISSAFCENDAHDRRNHFTRFFEGDRIADANVLAAKFVLVVKRGARNGAACEEDRLQFGDRG
jgi:hypothetical protein